MALDKVILREKLDRMDRAWTPKIVGELNGQQVKLAKLEGEFLWHQHEDEDELFLVISGKLRLELREGSVILEPGEFYIVPKATEHRPVALPEAEVMLLEPAGTVNTGELRNERTVEDPEHI